MTGKDVLLEKGLVEKDATMKRFQYSLLGSELKKQTNIAEKQYQRFDDGGEALTIKKGDKALPIKKYNRSNFIYNPGFTVYKFRDVIFWMKIFTSEYEFLNCLKALRNNNPTKENMKEKKSCAKCNFWIMKRFSRNLFRRV